MYFNYKVLTMYPNHTCHVTRVNPLLTMPTCHVSLPMACVLRHMCSHVHTMC